MPLIGRANKRAGFGALRGSLNPKITVSVNSPAFPKDNDIWVKSSDGSQYFWNGSAWTPMGGGGGEGESSLVVSPEAPADPAEGDIWIDGDTNIIYKWDGDSWEPIGGGGGAVYVQDEPPVSPPANSIWVDTNDPSRYETLACTDDTILLIDGPEMVVVTVADKTITLADCTGFDGVECVIKNYTTGSVIVSGTIDSSATKTLFSEEWIRLISRDGVWHRIG